MFALARNLGYMSRHSLTVAVGGDKNRSSAVISPLLEAGLAKTVDNGNGVELTADGDEWVKQNKGAMATLVVSQAMRTAPRSVFDLGGMVSAQTLPKRQKGN